MSFFSNPFKATKKIFKMTAPPLPTVNSHGSPGVYIPGRDNSFYAFGGGNKRRSSIAPTFGGGSSHRAHISPIMYNGGRIQEA